MFRYFRPAAGEGQLLALARTFVVMLGLLSLIPALWFRMIIPALLFTLTMWTVGVLIPTLAALMGWKLERIDIENCGKSRIPLGGLVQEMHLANLRFLYDSLRAEEG